MQPRQTQAAPGEVGDPDPHPDVESGMRVGVRWVALALGAIGVGAIGFFDLGPALAFNDDWMYAWEVRHFNLRHLQLYPDASAFALPQVVWAWVVTLGHADQRLLRLATLPFVLLAMYALHHLARRMGAGRTWSALAALTPLAFPVFAMDATSFMSDVPYTALLLTASLAAVRWGEGAGKRWIALCVAMATLSVLQRQTGVMIPVAMTVAFWWRSRDIRAWPRADIVGLTVLWVGCLGAVALPTLAGVSSAAQDSRLASVLHFQPLFLLADLVLLPGMLGFGLILFLPGLLLGSVRGKGVGRYAPALILVVALTEGWLLFKLGGIFPGNLFTPIGFAPEGSFEERALLFAAPLYLALEAMAIATVLLFIWRWRQWWSGSANCSGATLLLLAATQFLPFGFNPYEALDRYYIPVVLLLVPLAARAASQSSRTALAGGLALALAAMGVGLYMVGEQDYQAWQVARNQAACLAYQYAPPMQVNAYYEANAVYGEIPYYEKTGKIFGPLASVGNSVFTLNGPKDPLIQLVFARPGDPRPGYAYSSLASGKVVLVVRSGSGIVIHVPDGTPSCPQASR